ncbi:MAG TPA: VWA domain-containing protein [Bryobacteraceae bacterium]|nr:VWA domain-containing protein [Bryobacteraceae bacterium]
MPRLVLVSLLCGLLFAQQKQKQQNPATTQPQIMVNNPAQQQTEPEETPADLLIRVPVDFVVAPVLVFDRSGNYVNGIRPDQFRLWDNDKQQVIQVDETFTPISMVIAIQSNAHVEALLPYVRRIGNLVTPLLVGEQGEVAIIAYDHRIRTLQEFTSDPVKITEAVKKISPGSYSNCMIDAVVEGTRMLRRVPRNRRRILMVVGETRDLGSQSRARETLIGLQLANVMFYGVDMSRFITTLTAPPPVPRPDNRPPAMANLPGIVPATPTSVAQAYGLNSGRAEFIPLMLEILRDVKAIFKDNPVELFTKGTGGSEFGFHSNRTLEEAMEKVGEQLHSEYTISYQPTNRDQSGFHEIAIDVLGHTDVKRVQHRPGYWLGPETLKANGSEHERP